jgi:hypothetical protein
MGSMTLNNGVAFGDSLTVGAGGGLVCGNATIYGGMAVISGSVTINSYAGLYVRGDVSLSNFSVWATEVNGQSFTSCSFVSIQGNFLTDNTCTLIVSTDGEAVQGLHQYDIIRCTQVSGQFYLYLYTGPYWAPDYSNSSVVSLTGNIP